MIRRRRADALNAVGGPWRAGPPRAARTRARRRTCGRRRARPSGSSRPPRGTSTGSPSRWSVSFADIHTWRADSRSSGASVRASTRCQRRQRVGDRPADARGGLALVGDRVPRPPEIDLRRQGRLAQRAVRVGLGGAVVVPGRPRAARGGIAGIAQLRHATTRHRRAGCPPGRRPARTACCRAAARAPARSWRPPRRARGRSPDRSDPSPAGTSWPADLRGRFRRDRRIRARVREEKYRS